MDYRFNVLQLVPVLGTKATHRLNKLFKTPSGQPTSHDDQHGSAASGQLAKQISQTNPHNADLIHILVQSHSRNGVSSAAAAAAHAAAQAQVVAAAGSEDAAVPCKSLVQPPLKLNDKDNTQSHAVAHQPGQLVSARLTPLKRKLTSTVSSAPSQQQSTSTTITQSPAASIPRSPAATSHVPPAPTQSGRLTATAAHALPAPRNILLLPQLHKKFKPPTIGGQATNKQQQPVHQETVPPSQAHNVVSPADTGAACLTVNAGSNSTAQLLKDNTDSQIARPNGPNPKVTHEHKQECITAKAANASNMHTRVSTTSSSSSSKECAAHAQNEHCQQDTCSHSVQHDDAVCYSQEHHLEVASKEGGPQASPQLCATAVPSSAAALSTPDVQAQATDNCSTPAPEQQATRSQAAAVINPDDVAAAGFEGNAKVQVTAGVAASPRQVPTPSFQQQQQQDEQGALGSAASTIPNDGDKLTASQLVAAADSTGPADTQAGPPSGDRMAAKHNHEQAGSKAKPSALHHTGTMQPGVDHSSNCVNTDEITPVKPLDVKLVSCC